MSFQYIREMPDVREILDTIPVPEALKKIKEERDKEIMSVFKRESEKFLVIIGPCSADNEDAVCEYVSKLAKLQDEVKEKLILIPRIYTNKPRTTGEGYKGMAHQPKPSEEPNMVKGLKAITQDAYPGAEGVPSLCCRRDALSRELSLSCRYPQLCRCRRTVGRKPASPADDQRPRCPRRDEEPHERRPGSNAQLGAGRTDAPCLCL